MPIDVIELVKIGLLSAKLAIGLAKGVTAPAVVFSHSRLLPLLCFSPLGLFGPPIQATQKSS